jgi:hypothetical protein
MKPKIERVHEQIKANIGKEKKNKLSAKQSQVHCAEESASSCLS